MLFKPWSEFDKTPRHQLSDGLESVEVPKLSIKATTQNSAILKNPLLVVPYNLASVVQCMPFDYSVVARIEFQMAQPQETPEDEYLEDEQLYDAVPRSAAFVPEGIEVICFDEISLNAIVVPNLASSNPILYNLISNEFYKIFAPKLTVTLSPSGSNYNEPLCKLCNFEDSELGFNEIVDLKPPHFISGPTASFISQCTIRDLKCVALVMASEGVTNFERVDSYGLKLAAQVLADYVGIEDPRKYIVAINKTGYSNSSGMYI